MRYYLVKMYANDDEPARIEDNVYYDKIGKKAVVKAFDRRSWYHSTFRKIIKGVEYTPYIFHVFYKGHNVKKQQVIDVVNKIATIENIDNVICIDVEETSISDTLNENYNFAFPPQVLNFGNLWELGKFVSTKTLFYDWNVNDKFGKSKLKKLAKNTPNSASLSNEIEKIFSMDNSGCIKDGIPVHYIIKGSYKTNSLETLDILANALKQNNRTYSSHIIKFNLDNSCDGRIGPRHFDSYQDFIDSINENLAQALAGNLVVLQYGLDERHGDYAIESYMAVSKFIEILKPVSYCTPIIFSIPENSGDLDIRLQKMLDAPCVCLDVDKKFDASCKTFKQNFKYLENKAKDAGLVADRNLANLLREKMDDASFSDADKLFEEWYSENLIDKKFPAYTDNLNVIKDLRTNHDTDAMTQLEELIGLKHVKQQIKDFLARFKMNQELKKWVFRPMNFLCTWHFLEIQGQVKPK